MNEPPKLETLAQRLAVLEGRMEAWQSDCRADIARIGQTIAEFKIEVLAQLMALREEAAKRDADLARRDADFREELSRRDAASAKREISIVIWMAGLVSVGVAVIGLIVRWPF